MQKKSAGSENLIGVGGSAKDGGAKIWGQLVVGLLSNFKNRVLGGWLQLMADGSGSATNAGRAYTHACTLRCGNHFFTGIL